MASLSTATATSALERFLPVLPVLAGEGFHAVERYEPVNSGQRNLICRVWLRGAEGAGGLDAPGTRSFIAKFYSREVDRFFDHHFRREEKILALLNRWFGTHVPHLYGAFLAEGRSAVLLMEDVGRTLLDARLAQTSGAEHRELVGLGIAMLSAFHRVTAEHYQPFYRTCQSIDLDRLNAPTFERRLEVALGRTRQLHLRLGGHAEAAAADLARLAREAAPAEFVRAFRRQVVGPLLKAPRSVVHNSFSPVHVILNGSPKLIDYETIAVGAAQIDLAELLEAPVVHLDEDAKLEFARTYYAALAGRRGDDWESFAHVYHCAAIARSLDYAGTTGVRYAQFHARGQGAEAQAALERHAAYLRRAAHALSAIGEPKMAATVERLLAAVV